MGMEFVFDRRPAIPLDLRKIVQAEYAYIFRTHRVIVGCSGCDRKMLIVDTASDIPSCSGEISLLGEFQAGRNDLTTCLIEIHDCTFLGEFIRRYKGARRRYASLKVSKSSS